MNFLDFFIDKILIPFLTIFGVLCMLAICVLFYDGLTGKSCHSYAEKFELQSEYDFWAGCILTDETGKKFIKTAHKNGMVNVHKVELIND